jgi:hypothetical protein
MMRSPLKMDSLKVNKLPKQRKLITCDTNKEVYMLRMKNNKQLTMRLGPSR